MTREEFLEKYSTLLIDSDQKRYNEAVDDLDKLDENTWVNKYKQFFMDSDLDAGEVKSLVSSTKSLAERIRDAFGDVGFDPSSKWKATVYQQKFPEYNTPERRQELDEYLSKMKEYYDAEEKFRREEADRKEREKEVKDWGWWRNLLASGYEKQRYIDNPSAALFGKQATPLSRDWLGKGEAISDLALGVAAATADALPLRGIPGVLLGPSIRAKRDILHKINNSPYQKDVTEMVRDAVADAGINAGAAWLPNFRMQTRAARNATKASPVKTEAELIKTRSAIDNKDVEDLYSLLSSDVEVPSNTIADMVEALPESPMKQELMASITNFGGIDYTGMLHTMEKWHDAVKFSRDAEARNSLNWHLDRLSHGETPEGLDNFYAKYSPHWKPSYTYPSEEGPLRDFYNKSLRQPPKLSNAQSAMAWMLANANSDYGASAAKSIATGTGARMNTDPRVQPVQFDPEELAELQEQNSRFWDAGFEPLKNENDPLYEAFARWYERKHGFRPEDKRAKQ